MSSDLQVSIASITRGSNELKRTDPLLKAKLKAYFQKSQGGR